MQVQIGSTGTKFETVADRGCRTQRQFDAVMEWHKKFPAKFWCINPFSVDEPGQEFKCSFAHVYYDMDDKLCMVWVTPSGKIKMVDDARGLPMAQVFHDWYTDRWNDYYSDLNEPGWGISGDIAQLLLVIAPGVKAEIVKKALDKIK